MQGPWADQDGHRTIIHETGHYGLGLWDEYLDRNSKKTAGAYCASFFDLVPEDIRSSIMYYQYSSTELCSDLDAFHRHRSETEHDARTGGESTWETVLRRFADTDGRVDWTLQSPVERRAIVPGPWAIPVRDWMEYTVTDAQTGACSPFTIRVKGPTGLPMSSVEVWVERQGGLPALEQGKTDAGGEIELLGVHDGDALYARLYLQWLPLSVPAQILTCPSLAAAAYGKAPAVQEYVLAPDPFRLAVQAQPLSATSLRITAEASAALASNPTAQVWQAGAVAPLTVSLAYDAVQRLYKGQAALNAALRPEGWVQVDATDTLARTVRERVRFDLHPVPAGEITRVWSADDAFELVLPPGSLAAGAVVAIQQSHTGSAGQDSLVRVGSAYQVLVSTGQQTPAAPATVHMRYDSEQLAGVWPGTLRLYHWDEGSQRWILDGGLDSREFRMVSSDVTQLGVFALLGEPRRVRYLPLVGRDR